MLSKAPLVDPTIVPDTFVSGLAEIENLGGYCFRFTFYSTQRRVTADGEDRVVVAKLVASPDAVALAIIKAAKECLGWNLCGEIVRKAWH